MQGTLSILETWHQGPPSFPFFFFLFSLLFFGDSWTITSQKIQTLILFFSPFFSVKESDLETLVSTYGKAVQCVITREKDGFFFLFPLPPPLPFPFLFTIPFSSSFLVLTTGNSRGYGFLRMETPEQANLCVSVLNKSPFFGKNLTVEKVFVLFCCWIEGS